MASNIEGAYRMVTLYMLYKRISHDMQTHVCMRVFILLTIHNMLAMP